MILTLKYYREWELRKKMKEKKWFENFGKSSFKKGQTYSLMGQGGLFEKKKIMGIGKVFWLCFGGQKNNDRPDFSQ